MLSGPAAALGGDQFHWARVFLLYWNTGKPIVGLPKNFKRTKIAFRAVGDSQLNPQVAATIAGQMLSNKQVLALLGFVGSNETLGGGPVLDRGGMVYVSSSATRDDVAQKLKNFYRVVPNNLAQARLAVSTLLKNGVIKSGQQAMVVDDAEAYAANQADDTQKLLEAGGSRSTVSRNPRPPAATANFSALANKAVAIHADVVFSPTQVASDAQLFAQQLKGAGYKGLFVAADGGFDPTNFKFPGAYLTYFGADVNRSRSRSRTSTPSPSCTGRRSGSARRPSPPWRCSPWPSRTRARTARRAGQRCGGHHEGEDLELDPRESDRVRQRRRPLQRPEDGVTFFQIQSDGSYKQIAKS